MQVPQVVARAGVEGMALRLVEYPSGFSMPWHDHEQGCLSFVLRGVAVGADRVTGFQAEAGEMMAVPPGRPHWNRFEGRVRTFDVVLRASVLERVRDEFRLESLRPVSRRVEFGAMVRRLEVDLEEGTLGGALMVESRTLHLLDLARDKGSVEVGDPPAWLETAREYLHAHYSDAVGLDALAGLVGVHPSHLARTFRAVMGCTVGDYLRRVRVDEARRLLRTDVPLGDVALRVGFADQSHFCKSFRRETGMTPSSARRNAGTNGAS